MWIILKCYYLVDIILDSIWIILVVIRGKIYFFNFWALLLKMYHFYVCDIFFSPSGYPVNSLFQCQYVFIGCFWWGIFPLNYQNAYGQQTFQCGDMQWGALTNKYAWISMEWSCWVTWQIKYISPSAEDASTPQEARSWHSVRSSQTWPFDQVTNMRSRDCSKNLYLHFHELYS